MSVGVEVFGTLAAGERRAAIRFPIHQSVQLRAMARAGAEVAHGMTVNVSSAGVLIETDLELQLGEAVELAIDWPAQLNKQVRLRLIAHGLVARTEPGLVAVTIQNYEFRTRPTRP